MNFRSFAVGYQNNENVSRVTVAPFFYQIFNYSPYKLSKDEFIQKEICCLSLMIEAFDCFINGKLFEFDPFVGDRSCQLYAHKIVELFSDKKFLDGCDLILSKLLQINYNHQQNFDRKPLIVKKIQTELQEQLASTSLSSDQIYLVNCYVLKKISRQPNEGYLEKLEFIAGKRALIRLRVTISKFNQGHVMNLAKIARSYWLTQSNLKLATESQGLCNALTYKEQQKQFKSRAVYPGFRVLGHISWQQGISILLKSFIFIDDHMHIVLRLYTPDSSIPLNYVAVNKDEWYHFTHCPVLVVLGLSDVENVYSGLKYEDFYQKIASTKSIGDKCCKDIVNNLILKFDRIGILELLYASQAIRPQFFKKQTPTLSDILDETNVWLKNEFAEHALLAEKYGLHEMNASCYRPIHFYPDLVKYAITIA